MRLNLILYLIFNSVNFSPKVSNYIRHERIQIYQDELELGLRLDLMKKLGFFLRFSRALRAIYHKRGTIVFVIITLFFHYFFI